MFVPYRKLIRRTWPSFQNLYVQMLNETFRVYIIFEYCGNNAPFDVYDYDMDHLGIIRGPYIFYRMHEIETYS